MPPIIIAYPWTLSTFIAAHKWCWRKTVRPAFRWAGHAFIVSTAGLAAYAIIKGKPSVTMWVLVIIGVYFYTLRPYEQKWALRRQFNKSPYKDTQIEWSFTEESLTTSCTLNRSTFSWAAVSELGITADGFMIIIDEQICHHIPLHAFKDQEQVAAFLTLAKTHARRTRTVT